MEADGTMSPRSLAELATDAVCRSLIHLDGPLPPGLPPDVVSDIVQSLDRHAAWNATTLSVLRECELDTLDLTRSRGVNDAWVRALTASSRGDFVPSNEQTPQNLSFDSTLAGHPTDEDSTAMDVEEIANEFSQFEGDNHHSDAQSLSSRSTASFMSATSDPFAMSPKNHQGLTSDPEGMIISSEEEEYPANDAVDLENQKQVMATLMVTLLDLSGSQHLTDQGLLEFGSFERLEEARLDHCHSIVGPGLAVLAASHRLHTLSLAHCRRLTDEGVTHIAHLLGLESLSLAGCRCLTDRSIAAIADLYSLRHLDLSQCDLLTDAGVEQLESLETLEEVSFGWCRKITDRGLNYFSKQPGRSAMLRRLCLARCSLSDDGIGCLDRLKALEELNLNGCSGLGSIALGNTLQRLRNLTLLDVSYCPGIM